MSLELSKLFKLFQPFASSRQFCSMLYYAVAVGRKPGIYKTWDECKAQVNGHKGAVYKKFGSYEEAKDFTKCKTYFERSSQITHQPVRLGPFRGKRAATTYDDSEQPRKYSRSNSSTRQQSCSSYDNFQKDDKGFTIDDDGFVTVYTDGACSNNGRNGAKAGIGVWFGSDHPMNVSRGLTGRSTNNRAEIEAVTSAATQAIGAGVKKLRIYTDSTFVIKCINDWMPHWKRRGWMTGSKKPVINKEELIRMEKALAPLKVKWSHVRGHKGIHGNEMADKLAREGAESTTETE